MKDTQTTTHSMIHAYGRTQLALLYFPDDQGASAWRRLKGWIERCSELREEMATTGYTGRQRSFTPAQVRLIFEYLGEP